MSKRENKTPDIELSQDEIKLVELLYKIYLDNLKKCKDKEIARELGNFNPLDKYLSKRISRFGNVFVELLRANLVDVNDDENIVLTDAFFEYVEADLTEAEK